jgi:hypothetical protein
MERKLTINTKAKDLNVREHIAIQVLPMLLATAFDGDSPEDICSEAVNIAEMLMEKLNNENLRRY